MNKTMSWHRMTPVLFLALGACSTAEPPPAEFRFVEATIDDVHTAIRSGEMSCTNIIEGYLRRIDAYDKATGLNAIIFTNPDALQKASRIDEQLAGGSDPGPLFCIPVLLKDNFDTADMPTSGGSIALKDSVPPDDAFMVRKLREAGAIIIAKTNMAEWAFSPRQTVSSSYGRTANAYDRDRVPAGSSGGTASGTAASFGVIGMGSDTGNSIRGPSSHAALVGIRSTIGLTSRDGVIPLLFDRDIAGPMMRTVTDTAKVFNVIAGYDPADPYTEAGKDRVEADYTAFLDANALQGKRLGVLRALVDTEDADPQVTKVFTQALVDLEAAGAEIVDPVEIPKLDTYLEMDGCMRFRYDMYVYLSSLGDDAPIRDVMEARETGRHSPLVGGGLDYFGDGPLDVHPKDGDEPCLDFAEHEMRQAYLADTIAAMDAAGVDAIVYPSWTNPPAHIDRGRIDYKGDNSQLVAPDTGLPAITVPMGYTYGHLPAGLQMLGRPYSEGLLFGLAYAYEQETRHRVPPHGFPELGERAPAIAPVPYPHEDEPIGTVREVYDGALFPDIQANTFRNIHRLFPTRTVAAGHTPYPLPVAEEQLDNFRFESRGRSRDLYDYLSLNRVGGLLIVNDGEVVFERYLLGNSRETKWMSMSVVKSMVATLVGVAINDGYIDDIDDPLTKYLPQFEGSAYDGVSVRHLLQMASGVAWNETYTDPASDRRAMLEAQISQQPGSILDLMASLDRAAEPGTSFNYSTGETQVVGALVAAATGKNVADYLSEKIWQPFGMEQDATWWLDSPDGLEIGGSGLSATLRDYARFGLYMLNEGRIYGEDTLPAGWVAEATTPKFDAETEPYGYMWWPLDMGAYAAIGIFGQFVYVHPESNTVIAMWGAQPKPVGGDVIDEYEFFNAVVRELQE
jgi:Asp-tRNA(Asn)/Glu-tRNA(Gln) amidotransferase A subunit family amidase/CubicO group peptidase (beta-lactamase class C family)